MSATSGRNGAKMDTKPNRSARPDAPGGSPVNYEHRTTVNLMAAIAILLLAAGIYWTFNLISERQKLERCVGQGRRDCFVVPDAAKPFIPARR